MTKFQWLRQMFRAKSRRRRAARGISDGCPAIEKLEQRRVLTAIVAVTDGVLTVDLIANGRRGENITVSATTNGMLQVGHSSDANAYLGNKDAVPAGDIREIRVNGSHRKDKINLENVNGIQFPALKRVWIHGHAGRDRIIGSALADEIYGGDGRDRIYGQEGNDTIHGGRHRDFLFGQRGSDTIYGDGGKDVLGGGDENHRDTARDWLYGGPGRDKVKLRANDLFRQ